jgi:hypothetical protein
MKVFKNTQYQYLPSKKKRERKRILDTKIFNGYKITLFGAQFNGIFMGKHPEKIYIKKNI